MPHIRPDVLERLHVRLMVVTDDFIRRASGALLRTPKECFRGGRVAVLTQEYVHHMTGLVDHATQVLLESADRHEHLIHNPPLPERESRRLTACPKANQFGIGALAPGYGLVFDGRGEVPQLAMFGAPNNWGVDSSGKFTKDIETEQFKAALGYVRDLLASGVV